MESEQKSEDRDESIVIIQNNKKQRVMRRINQKGKSGEESGWVTEQKGL